jgi:hypothetical protein
MPFTPTNKEGVLSIELQIVNSRGQGIRNHDGIDRPHRIERPLLVAETDISQAEN